MKKHSVLFRIFVSFVVFAMILTGTNISAYADTELSITCPKSLCSKKIKLSGPLLYGATIPSSVPYLGGSTVNASNNLSTMLASMTDDDHLFIAYCPSYSHSGISKHAMALFRFSHKYTVQSYAKLTADVTSGGTTYGKEGCHLTTYKCSGSKRVNSTGTIITQELADGTLNYGYLSNEQLEAIQDITDTLSCNTTKTVYESHNWSNGSWSSVDGIYHQRTKTCINCGYTTTEKTLHNTTSTSWTSDSSTQHKRTVSCSVCGYSRTDKQDHSFTYSNYTSVNGTKHTVKRTCSVCGYTDTIEQNHSLVYGDWSYENSQGASDSINHRRTVSCTKCSYSDYETQAHNMVRDFDGWISSDNTWHYYTDTCTICNFRAGHYSQHVYNSNQNTYTDISGTKHRVTQTCKYCEHLNEYDEDHSFTTTCEPISETQHKFSETCVCGHRNITYGNHHDDDSDCYCDDCGYLMTRFSVTIPATLSIVMDKGGNVYTPTNAAITNNSTAAVKVTDITLTTKNGWTVVPYSTNMANEKVDSHKIGLKLRDSQSVLGDNMPVTGNWIVPKSGSLPLTYAAVVSATTQPVTNKNVLDVTFVIDWRD